MKKLVALVGLLILIAFSISVSAAGQSSGGVTITPAQQEIVIKNSLVRQSSSFSVENKSNVVADFELSTIDLGTLDETGGLIFSGLPQDYQKKYGLAEWVELPQKKISVMPQKVETVNFFIRNDETLSPGGHYGAIIVKQVPRQGEASHKQVTISPQAASILFLLKRGGEVYKLGLPSFKNNHSVWSLPTSVDLHFKNEGNVHVVPRGVVRLKNTLGQEIAKTVINPESSYVLPERNRTLHVNFTTLPRNIWPGRYTVEVEYRYDGSDKVERVSQTFFTANLKVLLLLIFTLVALLLLAYKFRKPLNNFIDRINNFIKKIVKKIHRKPRKSV